MENGQIGVNGQSVQSLVEVVFKFGQECALLLGTMVNGVKDTVLKIKPAILKDVLVCLYCAVINADCLWTMPPFLV